MLDRFVEFLDDVLHHAELLGCASSHDQIMLVINENLRAVEQVGDRPRNGRQVRRLVVDEFLELLNFGDGRCTGGGGGCFGGIRRAECRGEHKAFAQAVKPGLLHQPFGVLSIDDPNEFITNLELQIIVTSDITEKFAQFHISQVDA